MQQWILLFGLRKEAWDKTVEKIGRTSRRIAGGFPHASVNGEYQLEPASWWTAGFCPGLLWLIYRATEDTELRGIAESSECQLDQVIMDYHKLDHDIGFMWTLTSVARYKLLGETVNHTSRRTYSLFLFTHYGAWESPAEVSNHLKLLRSKAVGGER